MPPHPDSMDAHFALQAVLVLAEWTPPDGVMATVSCSVSPDSPDRRRVNVTLSLLALPESPTALTLAM